ncbi:MAG: hypothetical protein R2845_01675 [Thermomicrobiales bacterium]
MAIRCWAHRIMPVRIRHTRGLSSESLIAEIVGKVPAPVEAPATI